MLFGPFLGPRETWGAWEALARFRASLHNPGRAERRQLVWGETEPVPIDARVVRAEVASEVADRAVPGDERRRGGDRAECGIVDRHQVAAEAQAARATESPLSDAAALLLLRPDLREDRTMSRCRAKPTLLALGPGAAGIGAGRTSVPRAAGERE